MTEPTPNLNKAQFAPEQSTPQEVLDAADRSDKERLGHWRAQAARLTLAGRIRPAAIPEFYDGKNMGEFYYHASGNRFAVRDLKKWIQDGGHTLDSEFEGVMEVTLDSGEKVILSP